MLLEFDADQRLWQETVRDAVAKQCPPSLVRGVAEDGVDPSRCGRSMSTGLDRAERPETARGVGDRARRARPRHRSRRRFWRR